MINLTKEMILQAEHDILCEASAFDLDNEKEIAQLAFYNEGVHDMTAMLLSRLEEDQP